MLLAGLLLPAWAADAPAAAGSGADVSKVVSQLKEGLKSQNEKAVTDALRALSQMKEGGRSAVPDIVEATGGKLGFTRRMAVEALAACGADDPAAQKKLVSMLGDEKPLVRLEVVHCVGQTKLPVAQIVDVYVKALGDADERVRMAAAYALSQLPADAAAPVVGALKAEDPLKRAAATRAIGLSQTPPQGGPQAVVAALKDPDAGVRAGAAQALAWQGGTAASGAYDTLVALRKESDPWIRSAAVAALRHGGEKAIPLLVESLSDEDDKVRREAAGALVEMKGAAVKALEALSKNPSADLRWRSMEILKRIGPAASAAAPACLKALEDKEWFVRREAVRALTALAPKDEAVVAKFRDRVANDEEWTVRKESFDALKAWGASQGLEVKPY